MKNYSLLALLMFACVPGSTSVAAEPVFTVMTWNLEWFFDDSKQGNFSDLAQEKSAPTRGMWNWRRDAVAAAIASERPSIVALQEVEGPRVLWYLARALDREHALKYEDYAIEGNDRYTEQDVGLLTKAPAEVLSLMMGDVTERMRRTQRYASVPKHLAAIVEVVVDGETETTLVVNVHLRSGVTGDQLRAKQAESLNRWIQLWQQPTTHLILLGDFNSDSTAGDVDAESELAVLLSRGTSDPSDDLVDLLEWVPVTARQTHLLPGKQFDRILVSRSLVEDEPGRLDLCLRGVAVRPELSIRGGPDAADEHWNHYWEIDSASRDLSDHYPFIAEFEIR